MRHKTFFASIVRFPDRHGPIPPGSFRGRSTRFAAAMARVRRPVPFRTRKLRPCTAMVLHPRGCGRVARRRSTRYGSPRSSPFGLPGGSSFPRPTHARAPRYGTRASFPPHSSSSTRIPPFVSVRASIRSFPSLLPSLPVFVRIRWTASRSPDRGDPDSMIGGAVLSHAVESGGGNAMTTGPGARRRIPIGTGGAPAGRPAAPGRAAENGSARARRRGGRAGKRGRRRRESSLVYIGEDGGGSSVENMFHNGILSVG